MQSVTVLGATGVVGGLALDIIRMHRERFSVHALVARSLSPALIALCQEFNPSYVVVTEPRDSGPDELNAQLRASGCSSEPLVSMQACVDVCSHQDAGMVVTGMVGAAGLLPTVAAIRAGLRVLIANKEPVVMLGPLVRQEAKKSGALVLPVDSEHNAIFQCCASSAQQYQPFNPIPGMRRILLTGTGGPFRTMPLSDLPDITPEQAVAHPVWKMGAKISVDSATMMNKGLEIIEARWLFDAPSDVIEVVIHPQGTVHSMVEYDDGSVIAELATPDMRVPVANAMFWPERVASGSGFLDFADMPALQFEQPDWERFPCLSVAKEVSRLDGTSSVVLNAANEVAVDAFLHGRARFTDIAGAVGHGVETIANERVESLDQVIEVDREARNVTSQFIDSLDA